ncbi:MAG: glycosyltransferase, partial [Chloroflexota bacterium]|nr:glycosyltransferase [Chloroflexota bacterium]
MKINIYKKFKNLKEFLIIRKSGLFDEDYYLHAYPEVKHQNINPIMHYIKTGWHQGKNPSPDFDTAYYLRENKDIRMGRINPLVHYIQFGRAEDRPPNRSFTYYGWIDQYDTLSPNDRSSMLAHIDTFKQKPLISIVIPVFNPPEPFLREALDSVLGQVYPHWECCIADDASTEPYVRKILNEYQEKDPRFKITFREINGHISAASNTALSLASGDYIGFLDHDDLLREHTLYMVAYEINRFPDAEIIYSDEDLIDEFGVRYDPYFKPDWNPDLFYGHNLITYFAVYRRERVKKLGGFRKGYEGAQDWDLAMRITEQIPGSTIRHIPFILYHWRAVIGSTALSSQYNDYAKSAELSTLRTHFTRTKRPVDISQTNDGFWRVKHQIEDPKPLVSIIIPSRNKVRLLKKCLTSIQKKTQYAHYEILIVDNQTDQPESLDYLDEIEQEGKISVIKFPHPFNYSAINNFAGDYANGEVLIFLNNDIEVISPDWLDEMVGHALRPEIGAVGAILYYPNDTIQHA